MADDTPLIPVNKVGILGAGTMGGGIAMNFANAGIPVTIVEVKQDALDRGLATIRKNYERTAQRGGLTAEQVEQRVGLITGSLDMNDFADVDLVIEAVFERMDIKKDIFTKLDAICKQGAILATNTSALNIDEIAAVTKRPEAVIGLHFFSPANVMKPRERAWRCVVRHRGRLAMAIGKRIGKVGGDGGGLPRLRRQPHAVHARRRSRPHVDGGRHPAQIDNVLSSSASPWAPSR